MGLEQQTGIFLAILTNLLKVGFFVGIVWLFAQWWRESRYLNKHCWMWDDYSEAEKKRVAKKFSIFWPIILLVICIVLYLAEVVFAQCHLC